ncbi:MAG: RcnB family protein [Pseudomonadota bacterium]
MKRPATFAPASFLVFASLLASASALAAGNPYAARERSEKIGQKIEAQNSRNDRGHDNRGNDNRGHDRGNPQRNNNERDRGNHAPPVVVHRDNRDNHRNDRPGNDRRDWNDRNRNDRPDHNRNDWNGRNDRNDRWDRYRNDWNRHPHYNDNRRNDRRDYARYRFNFGFYHPPRGYSYRMWHRGDRLPHAYYGSSYIVYDWRPYRLYEPPYGYHWVRVGSDVVLTAIATGIVLDVLYNIWL